MPLNQRVQDQFQASIHTLVDAAELLSEPVAHSAQLITDCLMREGKILSCGAGASRLLACYAAAILSDRLDRERPGLAALVLTGGAAPGAATEPADPSFARQISALGHPGDVLLAISTFGQSPAVVEAVRAAHERDMRVIALVGGEGGSLAEILREVDVLICAPADSSARIHETLLLAIHAVCDGIDFLLLGA
jgi:D-sedoheptulose 7-phosphate isomerase